MVSASSYTSSERLKLLELVNDYLPHLTEDSEERGRINSEIFREFVEAFPKRQNQLQRSAIRVVNNMIRNFEQDSSGILKAPPTLKETSVRGTESYTPEPILSATSEGVIRHTEGPRQEVLEVGGRPSFLDDGELAARFQTVSSKTEEVAASYSNLHSRNERIVDIISLVGGISELGSEIDGWLGANDKSLLVAIISRLVFSWVLCKNSIDFEPLAHDLDVALGKEGLTPSKGGTLI